MISIEPGLPADGRVAAQLHASSITEGFLSSLGTPFLTRLYGAMARSADAVLLVARLDGVPAGFVAGSAHPGRFYRWFLRTRGPVAAASLLPRLIRPSVVIKIGETMRHARRETAEGSVAELLSIAVSDGARRSGVGAALIQRLEQELVAGGSVQLVVVVGASNGPARAFYERMGFSDPRPVRIHRGTPSVRYRKELRPASG